MSLGAEYRDEILAKWRSGHYTLEQLGEIAGGKISRSALQRYFHRTDEIYRQHRLVEDEATVWCAKVGDEPAGDVGQLCRKMLRVLAHSKIKKLNSQVADEVETCEIAALARVLKDIEMAESLGVKSNRRGRAGTVWGTEEERGRTMDANTLAQVKEMVRGRLE